MRRSFVLLALFAIAVCASVALAQQRHVEERYFIDEAFEPGYTIPGYGYNIHTTYNHGCGSACSVKFYIRCETQYSDCAPLDVGRTYDMEYLQDNDERSYPTKRKNRSSLGIGNALIYRYPGDAGVVYKVYDVEQ
jgi:hypothetical protein